MPLLLIDSYKKEFRADVCSLVGFVFFITILIMILLPFFIAYSTDNFWQRIQEYTEKPAVDFNNTYYLSVLSENGSDFISHIQTDNLKINSKIEELCSNTKLNQCKKLDALISFSKMQNEYDNKNDELICKIKLTTKNPRNIKVFFFLKYALHNKAKILFYPMFYTNIDIPDELKDRGGKITYQGELLLKQRAPIYAHSIDPKEYYFNPYDLSSILESPMDMLKLYDLYSNRNYTVQFKYETFIQKGSTNNDNLEIVLDMYIPKMQKVQYFASIFETLQKAWLQYFYILIPFYFIFSFLLYFILTNNVFDAFEKVNIKKKID